MTTERTIARRLLKAGLDRGYRASIWDGEDWPVRRSDNLGKLNDALGATDEESIVFRNANGERVASFVLIWGNAADGSELCADWGGPEADALYSTLGLED